MRLGVEVRPLGLNSLYGEPYENQSLFEITITFLSLSLYLWCGLVFSHRITTIIKTNYHYNCPRCEWAN